SKPSPSVRLLRRCPLLMGSGALLLATLLQGCSRTQSLSHSSSSQSIVTVGVAEGGDGSASDVGFQKIWPLLTEEGLINNKSLDGRPRPAIEESWTPSNNGLTWRVVLRPNVYFHDGTPCNAEAVKTFLQAVIRRPDVSQYPGLLDIRELRTD